MTIRRSRGPRGVLVCAAVALIAAAGVVVETRAPRAQAAQSVPGPLEQQFDQAKRAFDALDYEQAVQLFDPLITAIVAAGQKPDLLAQSYELRARARFALGDTRGAEQDFAALLGVKADARLAPGVSARLVSVLEAVRKATVGQLVLSMSPPGEILIDGRPYKVEADPRPMDITAGDHQVRVTRPGFRPISQRVTVTAAAATTLALALERVAAMMDVSTIPGDVEILVDGASRGRTPRTDSPTTASAPFAVELPLGTRRVTLRRDCYVDLEQTFTIRAEDQSPAPFKLAPAVATVSIATAEPGANVLVDGAARGQTPVELSLCAGPRMIDLRSPTGRFVDRREWKAGETARLTPELHPAFAIVTVRTGAWMPPDQLRAAVERTLAASKGIFLYQPTQSEIAAALRDANAPTDWLAVTPSASAPDNGPRVPRSTTRNLGRRVATSLGVQGLVGVTAAEQQYVVMLSILAAGSGEADVVTFSTADAASSAPALAAIGSSVTSLVRPSIEMSVADVTGTEGAVILRPSAVAAKAGVAMGDVIVGAGGKPVKSAADLGAIVGASSASAGPLTLDVKGSSGSTTLVPVAISFVPDIVVRDGAGMVYNRALLDLQETARIATTPTAKAAALLNLAAVQMRLGNYEDAQTALAAVQLPDGPGVSAGTVSYLLGLCLEATGRSADAQAAFTKAAAASTARLSADGPLIAPLAQQRLPARR